MRDRDEIKSEIECNGMGGIDAVVRENARKLLGSGIEGREEENYCTALLNTEHTSTQHNVTHNTVQYNIV